MKTRPNPPLTPYLTPYRENLGENPPVHAWQRAAVAGVVIAAAIAVVVLGWVLAIVWGPIFILSR
jgi:hypothetical protein